MPSHLFPRNFRKDYPLAVRGEGCWIFTEDGKRYLDAFGQAAVVSIGHGVASIGHAMARQAEQLSFAHTSQFRTPVAEKLAQRLLALAPAGMRNGGRVYFTSGGSEATETAIKLARQFHLERGLPERFRVIARRQSYHGSTLGAMALSGNVARRAPYQPLLSEWGHIASCFCARCELHLKFPDCKLACANELDLLLSSANWNSVAAFIFEPVVGATLGAAVPPEGYVQRLAEICREHDILLIADEVMTGMGRTGRNFAVDHWGVAPDILVAAKGLSSGYAPLGAVLASKKVVDSIAKGTGAFLHGFTYNAHPLSVAAGREVLRHMKKHDLVRAADSAAPGTPASHLKTALSTLLDHRAVGDIRGIGLLWGVEFVADKTTKTPFFADLNFAGCVGEAAKKRGLLVYPMQGSVNGHSGDHLLLAPPAVITAEQIDWAVRALREAVEEAYQAA